jgi:nucleotide-binding universal stress UspA family protein
MNFAYASVHRAFASRCYGERMENSDFRSILVPLDGSASADAALRLALRLVAPHGEVVIAHVVQRNAMAIESMAPYAGAPVPAIEDLTVDERDIFERASAQARDAGIRFSTVRLDGEPSSCILALAREMKVEAIAMGTHGPRGLARIVLGSTAAAVIRDAAIPTFVVRENAKAAAGAFRQIVVALDASPAAYDAARAAVDLAVRDDARVSFAQVAARHDDAAEKDALAKAHAYALASGTPNDAAILHGDAVDALRLCAETCHADLIVLGTGPIADAIVRTSPVPVLVLPIPAATGMKSTPLYIGG